MTEENKAPETTAPAGTETTAPAGTETTPAATAQPTPEGVVVVAAQLEDEKGVLAQAAIAAEGEHALLVARFADQTSATYIYERLREAEIDRSLHIDGVLVVKADETGKVQVVKMTEHSTKTGLKWGIVGGVIAGIVFPPSILASAVVVGAAGAAAGKARNLARRSDVAKELAPVITAGTCGILCLVSANVADEVRLQMPEAQEVKTIPVDAETAEAVRETAAEEAGGPPVPAV